MAMALAALMLRKQQLCWLGPDKICLPTYERDGRQPCATHAHAATGQTAICFDRPESRRSAIGPQGRYSFTLQKVRHLVKADRQ
ncbi:hypothetical protein, partial [Staphylococcus aureus]